MLFEIYCRIGVAVAAVTGVATYYLLRQMSMGALKAVLCSAIAAIFGGVLWLPASVALPIILFSERETVDVPYCA